MQFLLLMLLVVGFILTLIAVFFGVSYAIGRYFYTRDNPRAEPSSDPCAQCNADRAWFDSLSTGKRNAATGWWLANRYICAAKGCK